jgi:ribosomal protein L24
VHFVPGDSIRVVEGELKSLQGTVVHVDELQGIVRVRLRDEDWHSLGQAAKAVSAVKIFL